MAILDNSEILARVNKIFTRNTIVDILTLKLDYYSKGKMM